MLRDDADPAVVARQVVALVAGHRQICDALDQRTDLWRRIDEAWNLLLPTIATPEWLAQWRASDWSSRRRPRLSGEPPEDHPE